MINREQTERWILSKCGKIGETVWHNLRDEDLPAGISLADVRATMQRMNLEGHVDSRIIEPDNCIRQMRLTRLD
jgi:hypothetical protein